MIALLVAMQDSRSLQYINIYVTLSGFKPPEEQAENTTTPVTASRKSAEQMYNEIWDWRRLENALVGPGHFPCLQTVSFSITRTTQIWDWKVLPFPETFRSFVHKKWSRMDKLGILEVKMITRKPEV